MEALVYGPPGSDPEAVVAALAARGVAAVSWAGLGPPPLALDGVEGDQLPTLVRTVASLEACLARWPPGGPADPARWGEARARQQHLLPWTRVVVDTTHRDRSQVARALGALPASWLEGGGPVVVAESFSFSKGVPLDLDCCVDARAVRNPFWEAELRPFAGTDSRVRDFVLGQEPAQELLQAAERLVMIQLRPSGRARPLIRLAVGCTGGRHRSVALAEELCRRLVDRGLRAVVWHRDLDGRS